MQKSFLSFLNVVCVCVSILLSPGSVSASSPTFVRRQPRGERTVGREPVRRRHGDQRQTHIALQRDRQSGHGPQAVRTTHRHATRYHVGFHSDGKRRMDFEIQSDGKIRLDTSSSDNYQRDL